jgi:hypothetical protein
MRRRLMKFALRVIMLLGATIAGTIMAAGLDGQPRIVDDVYHAITTVRDMHSLGVSLEAYYVDHKTYPAVSTGAELKALLQGRYTTVLATDDAWGTPIKYLPTPDGQDYRLVSAGSDRVFDEASWSQTGVFTDSKHDAVYSHHFLCKWAIDIP